MILESFMVYDVEFYKEDIISKDSKPSLTYFADVDDPKKAAVEALQELKEKIKEYRNGKVKNPEGKDYPILENGVLLVNPKTGKKLDSLEGKLNQSQ
ncbi:hypothetical protein ES703_80152 [subsurface metagenome]